MRVVWSQAAAIFGGGVNAMQLAQEVCARPTPPYMITVIKICVVDGHAAAEVQMDRGAVRVLLHIWSGGASLEVADGLRRAHRTLIEPDAAEIWGAIQALFAHVNR